MNKSAESAKLDFTNLFSRLRKVDKKADKISSALLCIKARKRPNSMYILKTKTDD